MDPLRTRRAQLHRFQRRLRRALLSIAAASALTTGACGIPTELPRGWDTEFEIEATRSTLPVTQLLPSGVTIGSDRALFTLAINPVSFTLSLATMCPPCASANGLTVPKPAFQTTITGSVVLPTGVTAATLASGRIDVTLNNQLNFDPLRPSATARGSLTLTLRTRGVVVGTPTVVSGTDNALPPGGTLTSSIILPPRTTITEALVVDVTVDSPAGDPVTIDTSRRLTATASPVALAVATTAIRVEGKQVASGESILDLTDVDGYVRDHAKRGTLVLTVDNPFQITGTLTLRVRSSNATILKPVELGEGTTEREVALTQEELKRLFGSEVSVLVSGAVWGPAAGVVVSPRQMLAVDANLRVVLGPVEEPR